MLWPLIRDQGLAYLNNRSCLTSSFRFPFLLPRENASVFSLENFDMRLLQIMISKSLLARWKKASWPRERQYKLLSSWLGESWRITCCHVRCEFPKLQFGSDDLIAAHFLISMTVVFDQWCGYSRCFVAVLDTYLVGMARSNLALVHSTILTAGTAKPLS